VIAFNVIMFARLEQGNRAALCGYRTQRDRTQKNGVSPPEETAVSDQRDFFAHALTGKCRLLSPAFRACRGHRRAFVADHEPRRLRG